MIRTPLGPGLICGPFAVAHDAEHPLPAVRTSLLAVPRVLRGISSFTTWRLLAGFMLVGSQSTTLLAGGGLEGMIPSHPQASSSKRKPMDDVNPLGNAIKKTKKDVCGYTLHVLLIIFLTSILPAIREVWPSLQTQRYV